MAILKTPKVFTVGNSSENEFTPEQIELLTLQIRDWFISDACDRSYADPLAKAREFVDQCLKATTASGKLWSKAPDDFDKRIKIKTLFDMEDGNHVAQNPNKTPEAKRNAEHREAIDQASVSSNPTDSHVMNYMKQLETDILDAYPELNTPVHKPNVMRLALLYSEQERIRIELVGAKDAARNKKIDTLNTLQKAISDTMKALDIYPEQLRKRMDQQRQGSVGDLVALIDGDAEFKAREKRWALTLALQLWWMTKHPDGKRTGPQIHDFEMWHLTRTRPIRYECSCGRQVTLVEGFTPQELQEYLIDNGVLIEKPIIPQLMTEEDLDGLADYTGSESTPSESAEGEVIDGG